MLGFSRLIGVAALCWSMTLTPVYAGGGDSVFDSSFEQPFDFPESDAEAARFLNQASFGATPATISQIRATTLQGWITQQAGTTPTLSRPFLESLVPGFNNAGTSLSQTHRVQRWMDTAVTAPDQLRQRVAWALGQIVVVSDQDAGLTDEPIMMAEWNDILVRNALGNFRTLLSDTLRSPMMGRYLTHLRNRKFEITPRCRNQRNPASTTTVTCTSGDATISNGQTVAPIIVEYQLPTNGLIAPDENFAREIMQLFTIGLIERDLDFSPLPDASNPLPTYNQTTITTLSRVLTGLSYSCSGNRTIAGQAINRTCSCTGSDCSYTTGNFFNTPPSLTINNQGGLVHPDRYEAMICYPRYHDTGRDTVGFQLPGFEAPETAPNDPVGASIQLNPGQILPGGTPGYAKNLEIGGAFTAQIGEIAPGQPRTAAPNCHTVNAASPADQKAACLSYCNDSLEDVIDMLFLEPNTATMVSRQLIQRLVSSNPSPDYIERVANVFVNNGAGVRGDLRAVVTAILMDAEARQPVALNNVDTGKPREPLLKLVQLWRSFGAVSGDTGANGYRRWARLGAPCGSSTWPQCAYGQRPLGAPSVFNFYEPDFQVPGEIADRGLFSPEFQIVNESSSILAANDLYYHLCIGRGSGSNHNCHGALRTPTPTDSAYFPDAVLDGLPGGNCGTSCTADNDAALIAEIDERLFGGTMSGALGDLANAGNLAANTGMRGNLFRLLRNGLTGTFGEATAQNTRRREILYLLHLVAISPEYNTQR
jgi:uncharacterized protein (DUF1800 family)